MVIMRILLVTMMGSTHGIQTLAKALPRELLTYSLVARIVTTGGASNSLTLESLRVHL